MISKDEIQTLLNRMAAAYRAGDAKACAAMFTDNGQLHSPFAPAAVGKAALVRLHQDWTRDAGSKSFAIVDFGSTDTLAWCVCRFSEGGNTENGTSQIILERDGSGVWLIRSCCLFGDPEAD